MFGSILQGCNRIPYNPISRPCNLAFVWMKITIIRWSIKFWPKLTLLIYKCFMLQLNFISPVIFDCVDW